MGKQWKQCQTLFSWAPKSLQMVTAALKLKDTCSKKEEKNILNGSLKKKKGHLLLGRKAMTNLDSILKSRDSLPTKLCLFKTVVFPIVMYGYESWTIKKAECWRIDSLELWYWRRLFRVPWTMRRSNQSVLKEVSPEYWKDWCWSWNSNTLATWCEELTHWKRPWYWERLKTGGEGDDRGWDDWMASLTRWTWVWASSKSWWWTGKPGVLQSMGFQRVRHDWATELNWHYLVILPNLFPWMAEMFLQLPT